MIQDRKLGDEWEEWDGDLSNYEIDVETGKRVFLGFAILSIFLLALGTVFMWYLIKPRIQQINEFFAYLLERGVVIFIILLFFAFILTVLSIITNKNLLIGYRNKILFIFMNPDIRIPIIKLKGAAISGRVIKY